MICWPTWPSGMVTGERIDVVGSVDVGHYLVDVVARRAVVAMLTRTPSDVVVLALGRI